MPGIATSGAGSRPEPIALPPITQAGFDPIWFGVYLVIMVEPGQVTPPVGFNLFVLQGLTGHSIGRIALAAAPYLRPDVHWRRHRNPVPGDCVVAAGCVVQQAGAVKS